ncbi:outer membrane protein assembly factor BamB family protein [Cellulomonas phragmiteti]|uniref:Pyrrolo-quinoline quinone repeat domain-containing protein n=1 Tax=Cellulomonas phragmiteti TaxID=478780 RepID=A0ABQ4DKP3_9CELL|nr:PQQ-binding-like beta-propeller repeat protein [Cellulomonas phragmiteti]GIG39924.1 hypothetical protein Cph01nite_16860 [Cellulomonas phragmiteti]
MGAVRPASQMRPVELVEEDDDRPGAGGASARDDAPRAGGHGGSGDPLDGTTRAPGRRRWPWLVAALALAVGVAALATGVTERAARERADAFAALPGVVRPLEAAPVERWRTTADGPTPVLGAAGAVVTVARTQGTWAVRSSDPTSGEVRWQVEVVAEAGSGFESVAVACAPGTDPAAVLICLWNEPNVLYGSAGESTPYVPPTHVLALDPDDGATYGTWQIEGRLLGVTRHDDDLVVATGQRDRHVLVERRGSADGDVRWSWTSPGPLVDSGGVRAAPALADGGSVVALVAVSTTVLDVRTGDVLEAGPPGRQILVGGLPDGGYVTWESAVGGTLRDPDGSVRGAVPALPSPVVGDGSVDALLLDAGNRALAVQPTDGAVTWALPTSMTPVAVARGVVVMAGDATVGAVDGVDGRLLWEQRLAAEQRIRPLTDGLHVLTAEPDGADGHELVARGLRDGVEAWRVALPADLQGVAAVSGLVVVRTGTEVIVLR